MSFSAYFDTTESGFDWLGEVPSHWNIWPFKRIIDIQNGADHKEVVQDEGFPVIGSGGTFAYASEFMYDGKSVLLGRKGTIDKPLYVTGKFWTVDTMYWSVISPDACGKFAYYVATTIPFALYSTSTALPSMTKGALHAHPVAVPPLNEQKAIASFLDGETSKIDGLVSEQHRLIELLAEKRQAVISHAVTKGLDPNVPMKTSGIQWLGDVPEHWEVYRMGVLYSDTAENGNDKLPVLQVSIHHGVSDRELTEEESDRKITRIEDKSKYKRVIPNDLVYNMMRAWQGGFGTVRVEGMVSPAYVVARPNRDFHTQYIEHLLRTPQAIEQMRRYSHGVTDFRLRLYWDKFKNVRVALPDKNEQQEICDHISEVTTKFDRLAAEAERAIELLQERRSALISAAVTGKIDVREFTFQEAV